MGPCGNGRCIYRTKECALILIVFQLRFQDSIQVSQLCRYINQVYWLVLCHLRFVFHDKYICSLQSFTPPFQQQTRNAVHYSLLHSLCLVGPVIHQSQCDFCRLIRLTQYSPKQQCLCGYSSRFAVVIKKKWMMISNL